MSKREAQRTKNSVTHYVEHMNHEKKYKMKKCEKIWKNLYDIYIASSSPPPHFEFLVYNNYN